MKKLITLFVVFSTLLLSTNLQMVSAGSWQPFGGDSCDNRGANSTVCDGVKAQRAHPNQNPLTGTNGLLLKVANIIAVIAGVAAVIIIVLAGLRFIQSGGSTEDVAGARRSIIYASVGLIIIVLARSLLGLVLNAL